MTALSSELSVTILFIYALRDVPFKKVAQTSLVVSMFLLLFVIISAKLGIITNYIEVSGSRVRTYLGFRYALFPSILLMNIVAIVFYLKQINPILAMAAVSSFCFIGYMVKRILV